MGGFQGPQEVSAFPALGLSQPPTSAQRAWGGGSSKTQPWLCPSANQLRGWAAPAAHSQRQTLRAQLCPQQLLLPSVPPALKWVSPSQPPGERTGSVRAPRNQGARPQDLGLLSTERAQVGAGFREPGALPGACTTVEQEGGPLPPQDSSLSAATLSSWGMGRGVPPSPWKRGHSQRAEAMQSSLEKQ